MKSTRRIICFLFAAIIISAALTVSAGALGTLPAPNSQQRHIPCEELSDQARSYYTADNSYEKLSTLSGADDTTASYSATRNNELYTALHNLMSETHSYYSTYSGTGRNSLAYYWNSTDAVQSGSSYIMFYSDIPSDTVGVRLNREHIWPKSRASYGEHNGGSDLHHLRPSVDKINSAKSDHLFGNIDGVYTEGVSQVVFNGELYAYVKKDLDLFECKDDVKGDVARILLYVYCRWEQPNLYTDMTSDLPAPEADSKSNSGKRVIESLDTLLSWCESDPVDTWEMERNDLIQSIQGNRNVFIDYPELAWRMFGRAVPDDMTTPSGKSGDTPSGKRRLRGDADGDGEVTAVDATAIQRSLILAPLAFEIDIKAADVNGDGLDITDATSVQRFELHISNLYGIGEPI